jgi:hypothetical protein
MNELINLNMNLNLNLNFLVRDCETNTFAIYKLSEIISATNLRFKYKFQ